MKIISWNVNGIRAAVKNGFKDFLTLEKPDILLLQETKIDAIKKAETDFDFQGYAEFWNPAIRKGYSGTAILIREEFLKKIKGKYAATNGIAKPEFDEEGRIMTLELEKFYLVNAYFPNANHELSRLSYKLAFNTAILQYLQKLKKIKPVFIGGDFNVAHQEIDLKNPKENRGSAGFTDEERLFIDIFIKKGYIDAFRYFNGDKVQYSWWSYRFRAREKNIGWRIDCFFASAAAIKLVKKSYIMDNVKGSDHCPVVIEI